MNEAPASVRKDVRVALNDGTELEDLVFRMLRNMLDRNELPYRPEHTRLYRRKAYYSPQREGEIAFENVLEVYFPDAAQVPGAQPTHVVVFECKDLGRNVQVDTVEAIVGKKQTSFGFSIKFHIVTRGGFSDRAINMARANGIGLIKIMPDEKVHHVMYHMTPDLIAKERARFAVRARRAIADPDYESAWEDFYGYDGGCAFDTLGALLDFGMKR